jgi:hypothetical protein
LLSKRQKVVCHRAALSPLPGTKTTGSAWSGRNWGWVEAQPARSSAATNESKRDCFGIVIERECMVERQDRNFSQRAGWLACLSAVQAQRYQKAAQGTTGGRKP